MSTRFALDSPAAAVTRRQLLLTTTLTSSAQTNHRVDAKNFGRSCRRSRMGETTGDCAAVCCCCPCAMLHLLILAVYRLPRGLWRKKKRKRLLKRKNKISWGGKANPPKSKAIGFYGCGEEEDEDGGGENDIVDWDNETWDQFYGAGFWRSASQRNDNE